MRLLAAVALFTSVAVCLGATDADWEAVLALEKGPSQQPSDLREAKTIALEHLALQRRALEQFVAKHPGDGRVVDARISLASLHATSGKIDSRQSRIDEAMRQFQAIENDASLPPDKRAEAGFRRVSLLLQSLDGQEGHRRGDFVNAARNFVTRHPRDPRGPRLLVEVATICDDDPKLKRELLKRAASQSVDASLKSRITDDLKRLELLGRPFELEFPVLGGGGFRTSAMRGRVGVLVFWSADSVPSILWMRHFRRGLAKFPSDRLAIATMALDSDRQLVDGAVKQLGIAHWPTGFDGKGWESPIARACGINALPTVFVLDQRGVLRSINARNNYTSLLTSLLVSPAR